MIVDFTIPGPPKGKGRPRMTRGGRTYTPSDTVQYENLVKTCYGGGMFSEPIEARLLVGFPIPASWSKKKQTAAIAGEIYPEKTPDCDNVLKIVLDALNGIAYDDDKRVVVAKVRKVFMQQPETRVILSTLELGK